MNFSLRELIKYRFEMNLRYQMRRNGYIVTTLSKKTNIPARKIRKWLANEVLPNDESIIKLNRLFGVNTDYWLRADED